MKHSGSDTESAGGQGGESSTSGGGSSTDGSSASGGAAGASAAGSRTECQSGELYCGDGEVLRCADDGLSSTLEERCGTGQYCEEDRAACVDQVCSPGNRRCGAAEQPQRCTTDGSAWADDGDRCSESEMLCLAGECIDFFCQPDEEFCSSDAVRLCAEDGLSSTELDVCQEGEYCDSMLAECVPGVCAPSAPACDGDIATTCSSDGSGYSGDRIPCGSGQSCDDGECKDQVCVPGETFCQGNSVLTCSQNGLATSVSSTCDQGEFCSASSTSCVTDVCASGARRCGASQQPQLCDDEGSGWTNDGGACSGTTPVCLDGECVECDAGQGTGRQCVGDTPEICSNGSWITQPPCSGDTPKCDPGTGLCVCQEDDTICLDADTEGACRDGEWEQRTCRLGCDGDECRRDTIAEAGRVTCDVDTQLTCNAGGTSACCLVTKTCGISDDCPLQEPGVANRWMVNECDLDNDCPSGQVCCFLDNPSECGTDCRSLASCDIVGPGVTGYRLLVCDPLLDPCPAGRECQPAPNYLGYPVHACEPPPE